MSNIWVCVISGAVLTFILVAGVWAWRREVHDWNGGRCRQCGDRLYSFDMDSQGGRGYRCAIGHYLWISYPGVDRDYVDPRRSTIP